MCVCEKFSRLVRAPAELAEKERHTQRRKRERMMVNLTQITCNLR